MGEALTARSRFRTNDDCGGVQCASGIGGDGTLCLSGRHVGRDFATCKPLLKLHGSGIAGVKPQEGCNAHTIVGFPCRSGVRLHVENPATAVHDLLPVLVGPGLVGLGNELPEAGFVVRPDAKKLPKRDGVLLALSGTGFGEFP